MRNLTNNDQAHEKLNAYDFHDYVPTYVVFASLEIDNLFEEISLRVVLRKPVTLT